MADDQDLAALRAQVTALETQLKQMQLPHASGASAPRGPSYVIHTHVHPACFELCYMPLPIGDDDAPTCQQLGRIEEQLERVIALLEQRST